MATFALLLTPSPPPPPAPPADADTELILKAQIQAGGRGKGTFKPGFVGGVQVLTECVTGAVGSHSLA